MTWERMSFGQLFKVKHGYAFKSQYFEPEGPYVLLTPGNFQEAGGFRDQGEKQKFYTGDVPSGFILDEGDILVAMTEQAEGLLGSSAWIPEPNLYLHNQRLGLIVELNENRLDKRYLYYLFNKREVRHQIAASASGTKVKHTAPERIGRVVVDIPLLPVQQRIASIVTAYDDLIENNRRRMVLLEDAARQLYREWFVRLRFPGREHTKIVDGVPEGWERSTVGEISADIRGTVAPENLEPETPYIGLEHIPRRSITLAEWGQSEEVTSTKLRFQTGDVIFGKIRPYFHKVGIALVDGVSSSDAIIIRPLSEELRSLVLMTASSDPFVAEASQTMREGSKMPRADWKIMKQYPVALPPKSILDTFNSQADPMIQQLRTLAFQNRKLQEARDLLLPRLMSGEIAI
jgi:type I restriction enzyme S subunit